MQGNLYLIGFMGAGKSTVGKMLAEKLLAKFIDLDARIEEDAGCPIPMIFAKKGEQVFRDVESKVLEVIAQEVPAIVATGGGVVRRERNWRYMRQSGLIIYLRTNWESLQKRLGSGAGRPLADDSDNWRRTRNLWLQRCPLYEQADITVDTDERSAEVVVSDIMKQMNLCM